MVQYGTVGEKEYKKGIKEAKRRDNKKKINKENKKNENGNNGRRSCLSTK